jgi:HAMP domain-containing protein/CheY-like chemotaxis protein/signal transduction histidine kinase
MDEAVSVQPRLTEAANSDQDRPGAFLSQLLFSLRAVRDGEFSVRLPADWPDQWGRVSDAFNEIVATNQRMANELALVGQVVGREGKTKQRVRIGSPAGAWGDMEASINSLIDDLLWPTTEVTRTIRAVAQGDLLQTMRLDVDGRPLAGEFLRSATIVNTMIKQLSIFTSEVTRVAREVGTDGKLGGQAQVSEVTGVWKDLTESVNSMASNLTAQVRNIAEVTIAVANGDLSKKITVDVRGEILLLKEAINTMVDQLRSFAAEVTRVAREVGTEGRLGGQAVVPGVAGTWKDLTDNVNLLAANLTTQVRNIAEVTTAVARGDLSRKITVGVQGEILELKNTINTMVDQLNAFASEVTRVAREVGTEGRLGGQAKVPGVAGTWKDLTDNVNSMAGNLTNQVRNIAEVATAIAGGDLSKKITVNVSGEILQLKETINTMVDQLNAFAFEVTRVAREVGTEGRLGGQAEVRGVAGTWKDLTDSVNSMASNLTTQVRNIAEVSTAIANGDLSKKIDVDARGEVLELKETINTMVDQLNAFAGEVTRVAREVGTEGKLGGQAVVHGVAGTWKDLTDNVNLLAANLTTQVRNIADVTTAVARGDLSRKITVDVRGEILELKATINTMVDQLNAFAGEVTRVAREVGTEGKLGGQAQVPGVAGTWKDLTDNVNFMASNLTAQVRNISEVATAIAQGDLSRKISVDVRGEILSLKETLNTMVEQLRSFAAEVTRVAREVGTEGRLGGQAVVPGVGGTWKDLTDSVNSMAGNLTAQVRNIAEVTTAVARGDLSRKITVDVKGEILELKNTINTMVDQLNAFASEVTRVAREVGTEGKLGGQAQVSGVAGTWKDLTDTVNVMAANLTEQVRGIVKVVTAVAEGDLKQRLTVNSKGEVAALAETINDMTGTLAIFAEQVTTVAREVGVEGRLGGQANVPGAAGTWKDLIGNVNLLADNLTNQVRAIAEVATAVTKGDLTRSIQVDASGEVAELKDYINTMIDNLRLTTERNTDQDWLKTNLARFTGMLQGQRDLSTVGSRLLSELVPLVRGQQGVIYQMRTDGASRLNLLAKYADHPERGYPTSLELGQGLIGQCAVEKRSIVIVGIPEDTVAVSSIVLEAKPRSVAVFPVIFEDQLKAVLAVASIYEFDKAHLTFLEQLTASIGIVLNSIEATMQTESLLKQSQELARELQLQQKELQTTNDQLEQKAQQLAERNVEVEAKNQEIEHARRALEEKASELALTSKYKSEFLANMSHELRTPLNSILILGQQLGENRDRNLTEKQVEFAKTIHAAGSDLLNLISDILDLSKIESGTVSVDAEDIFLPSLVESLSRPFRHEAENKGLSFEAAFDADAPRHIYTDAKRLQQVLKNLLSNAFKFTAEGGVTLRVEPATSGWNPENAMLNNAPAVLAFEVTDTGIGIPPDKQKIIFEAFQQADASTSRKYGGTGLGLAISRELTALLGGEIQLRSVPNQGSTFTLFLPQRYAPAVGVAGNGESAKFKLLTDAKASAQENSFVEVGDDRDILQPGDAVLLIVDDDPRYARVLADLARDQGFRVIIAPRGADAIALASDYNPTAISLEVFLPDMPGWSVLSQLKQNPATRHIPVLLVTLDTNRQHGLAQGAFAFLTKPTSSEELSAALRRLKHFGGAARKRLLVVEDNPAEQLGIKELLGHDDIEIEFAETGREALERLSREPFDCVVLDLKLPDMSGFEVMETINVLASLNDLPIIVFTGRELSPDEDAKLRELARSVIVKGVESPERLLDETALFLHRVVHGLPPEKQRMLDRLRRSDDALKGRSVLIVDDDARNIFALSSVLERRGMSVITATTGREAIDCLERTPSVSIVLMDIMMPEMDGYQTMQAIRADDRWRRLPIVALTAKAMKGDREKCLEAGASDYLAKPVDTEQLLMALRMWLHR